MIPGAALTFFFQLAIFVGFVLTSIRLYSSGLFRRYRVFFAYLVFSALLSAISLPINPRLPLYAWLWVTTEPVLWVFYVLVVLELYRLVLEKYQGLYTFGRWAMWGSIAVAIALSSLSLLPKVGAGGQQKSRFLNYYYVIERGLDFALLIFLLLILLILSRFPVKLSRNVVVHCVVYTAFFLSNSLGLFLRSLFGLAMAPSVSMVLLGVTAVSVLLWALFLDEKGEAQQVSVANLGPEQEEHILTTLHTLNDTLLRSARK